MKFINIKKFNEIQITKNLFILIFFIYICWLFKTYSGNHHSCYIHLWKYVSGAFSFENDFFLKRTSHDDVTIIYQLFKFLKISPDNDYVGFIIHILFSTISGYFLFKILKDYTPIKEKNGSLIIIFSLLMIGSIFVHGNFSSWIIRFQAAPTYFAHQLIFVFLWLLLSRKIFWLFIISSLMLGIMIKASWFTVCVGMLYSLLFIRPMKNNVWIIGPLLTLGYLSTLSINTDSETNLLLFNYLLFRDNAEVAFHLQQKIYFPKFIALIISFPIYFFMLNKIKESTFKKLALTLFISSIFCFLIGYLYGLYGAKFWPEPRLLALSPTRALGIYQLFFWILLCLSIYKFNTYQIYKICLFVSIFYLLTLSVDSVLFTLFVFLIALLTINYYKRRNFLNLKNLILNKSTKLTYFSTLLFFLILSPGVFYLFATHLKHVDTYALKNINKWTMGPMEHDNNRLDTAIMLQKCNDFNLLDLKINSEGKPQYWEWTSAIAGKSNYYGGVNWNYFDKETYHTSKHRQKIIFNIINNMQKKIEINHQDKDELLKTGVIAIIYDDERKYFSKDITSFDLENNDTLLVFLKGDKKENFSNNCVKHLKIK